MMLWCEQLGAARVLKVTEAKLPGGVTWVTYGPAVEAPGLKAQ